MSDTTATGNTPPPVITRSENEQLAIDVARDSVKNQINGDVHEGIGFTFIAEYAAEAKKDAILAAAAAEDAAYDRDRLFPAGSQEYVMADAYAAVSQNAANNAKDANAAVAALQKKAKIAQRRKSNRSVFSACLASHDAAHYAYLARHERVAAEIAAARAANPDTKQLETPDQEEAE